MARQSGRIVVDDDRVRGGEPHIRGRRITVRHVHELVEGVGLSAREVADRHELDVADVYRALAYYHENRDEMRTLAEREREQEERARADGARTLAELADDATDG